MHPKKGFILLLHSFSSCCLDKTKRVKHNETGESSITVCRDTACATTSLLQRPQQVAYFLLEFVKSRANFRALLWTQTAEVPGLIKQDNYTCVSVQCCYLMSDLVQVNYRRVEGMQAAAACQRSTHTHTHSNISPLCSQRKIDYNGWEVNFNLLLSPWDALWLCFGVMYTESALHQQHYYT